MNDLPASRAKSTTRRAETAMMLSAAALPTLTAWLYFVALAGSPTAIQQTSYLLGKGLQFALPLLWFFAIRQQPLRWRPPRVAGVVEGLVFGAAVFGAIVLGYFTWLRPQGFAAAAVGPIAGKLAGFGVDGPGKFAALALFYCAIHSLLEEYYWRWFLFGGLRRLLPLTPAVLLSAAAFAAHHVIVLAAYFGYRHWETWLLSLGVAVGGAIWARLYHRSGSLLGPWLSHLLVDAGIFFVGYELLATPLGWR